MFREKYADVFSGNETWNSIEGSEGDLFGWSDDSTYIQEPPFFIGLDPEPGPIQAIRDARVLAVLGDSITTDHISPAGSIAGDSPAGKYLMSMGVQQRDFNSYGSRRGNDRIMTRGTFANIRLKNRMVPGVEGGYTVYLAGDGATEARMNIFDAAMRYQQNNIPLVIFAGKEYGTGSSRDWAAKGTILLGVEAVIAESFERIHRSNLVGMGVLPLQFKPGDSLDSLGLTGREVISIDVDDSLLPQSELTVRAVKEDGSIVVFKVIARLNTEIEVAYYRNGGILQTVLRNML